MTIANNFDEFIEKVSEAERKALNMPAGQEMTQKLFVVVIQAVFVFFQLVAVESVAISGIVFQPVVGGFKVGINGVLYITLDATDTYTIHFFKFTAGRLNKTTFAWTPDKQEDIKIVSGVRYAQTYGSIFV